MAWPAISQLGIELLTYIIGVFLGSAPFNHYLFRKLLLSLLPVAEHATEKTQSVYFCLPASLPD